MQIDWNFEDPVDISITYWMKSDTVGGNGTNVNRVFKVSAYIIMETIARLLATNG